MLKSTSAGRHPFGVALDRHRLTGCNGVLKCDLTAVHCTVSNPKTYICVCVFFLPLVFFSYPSCRRTYKSSCHHGPGGDTKDIGSAGHPLHYGPVRWIDRRCSHALWVSGRFSVEVAIAVLDFKLILVKHFKCVINNSVSSITS